MNVKQAQAVLSDFLRKCEGEDVALPTDPLRAVVAAIRALQHQAKHELGRAQMEAAMAQMREQFGVKSGHDAVKETAMAAAGAAPTTPQSSRRQSKRPAAAVDASLGDSSATEKESKEEPTRTVGRNEHKRSKLQDEIRATRAKRSENQRLVDQLVQLAEFELKNGHSQRGIARLRAAEVLRDADTVITSGAQARQLRRVGPSSAAKVDTILHSGLEGALKEYTGI